MLKRQLLYGATVFTYLHKNMQTQIYIFMKTTQVANISGFQPWYNISALWIFTAYIVCCCFRITLGNACGILQRMSKSTIIRVDSVTLEVAI